MVLSTSWSLSSADHSRVSVITYKHKETPTLGSTSRIFASQALGREDGSSLFISSGLLLHSSVRCYIDTSSGQAIVFNFLNLWPLNPRLGVRSAVITCPHPRRKVGTHHRQALPWVNWKTTERRFQGGRDDQGWTTRGLSRVDANPEIDVSKREKQPKDGTLQPLNKDRTFLSPRCIAERRFDTSPTIASPACNGGVGSDASTTSLNPLSRINIKRPLPTSYQL